jgi:hypothetical protein
MILAMALGVFGSLMAGAMKLELEADRMEAALRAAESQIEWLRAMPADRRPVGRGLAARAGAEALANLPDGTCAIDVEPDAPADAGRPGLRVRVRVAWSGDAAGEREVVLNTLLGDP